MHDPYEELAIALEPAGVTVPRADREALLESFRAAREKTAMLFAVADARYEEPALVFSARIHGGRS